MANVNVNIRSNANVRGTAQPNMRAQVALQSGGMRIDSNVDLRGANVRAQFAANDSFGAARMNGNRASLSVTGMGDLNAQVSAHYGNKVGSFQFEAKANRANMQFRLNGANSMRDQANIAVEMGMMRPRQAAEFNVQVNNFNNFAQFQMGRDAGFQATMDMYFNQQDMAAQLGAQQNMLQSLGLADAMMQQQMGMQQAQFNAFQGQVGAQFGQIEQILGQFGAHNGFQDQILAAHSQGLGQLTGDLMALGQQHQGLSGIVDGLSGKLGALNGSVDARFLGVDAQVSGLSGSVDARFSGVDAQVSKLLSELDSLRGELAAARQETSDLRGSLGTETVRLDTKIDTLAGRVEAGFKDVKGQLDTAVSSITARLDKEIAGLQASQSELATNLRTEIAGVDAKLTTATGELKLQLETQKKELSAKLDAEVAKLEAVDAKLAADLKSLRGEYEGFAKQTQEALAAQSARIDGAYKEIADTKTQLTASLKEVETKLTAAIAAGDANLQAQLNDQKTQITNVMVQVNKHEVTINAHEATLKAHASQITAAMSTATTALATAKDAKGLAEALQGQVNTMKGDINQLFANDHSFSALNEQWWKALEQWHGSHFLVNQGMQGNAHIRFDPLVVKFGAKAFGEDDFNATATTKMVTGADTKLKWPADTNNVAALVIDPSELKKLGYTVANGRGEELTDPTLFRDGLRLKGPDGKEIISKNGWDLMAALDANKDGKLTKADPAVQALKFWFDNGANAGAIDARDRMTNFVDAGVEEIGVTGGKDRTDKHGNTFSDGTIKMANGSDAAVTDWFAGKG